MSRVISFSSGKGGVGKTAVVSNLGCLYARAGLRTLLIDGDWTLGKLGIPLGVRPKWTIEKVLAGEVGLMDAICPVSENLSILAAPSGVPGFEELDQGIRDHLFFELERVGEHFDRILLDHSSGVSGAVLQFAAACHQQVIVTTCEPTSYTDAYAIMKLLSRRFGIRDFHLLVTLSDNQLETERIISRFMDVVYGHLDVRVRLLDILPRDPRFPETVRRQKPFVQCFPTGSLTRQMERIREALEESPVTRSHGLRFFLEQQSNCMPAR